MWSCCSAVPDAYGVIAESIFVKVGNGAGGATSQATNVIGSVSALDFGLFIAAEWARFEFVGHGLVFDSAKVAAHGAFFVDACADRFEDFAANVLSTNFGDAALTVGAAAGDCFFKGMRK